MDILFPSQANNRYTVVTYHGVQSKVAVYGKMDKKGNAQICFPDGYMGVASLYFNDNETVNMIVSGESFSICNNNGSILFSDKENRLMADYASKKTVSNQSDKSIYAQRLISIFSFLEKMAAAKNMIKISSLRSYIMLELSADDLYNSGLWENTMSAIEKLYITNSIEFENASLSILNRTKRDDVFQLFIKGSVIICERMGWDKTERILLDRFITYTQIMPPTEGIKRIHNLALLKEGSKAPILTQGKLANKNKTIILFYETECDKCKRELSALISAYNDLKEQGYDVISIASDSDKDEFEKTVKTFPWEMAYYDLQAMDGADFLNYGVMGTPTFYLIDQFGEI